MPRDTVALLDAPVRHPEEIAILDKMAELLATPERWCRCVQVIRWRPNVRYGYCLVGALRQAQSERPEVLASRYSPAGKRVAQAFRSAVGRRGVFDFNDDPETTHADILALIARARQSFE